MLSLRNLGYQVEVEKPVGAGRTIDLVVSNDGEEIAIELETADSDFKENVERCIEAGFRAIVVLVTRRTFVHAVAPQMR